MRLLKLIVISMSLTLFNTGCATIEDDMPEVVVQPTIEWSEAEEINHWIYGQMNHHYLWREDLPDSLSCDYTLTPKEFFESLLSDKDRFSYLGQKGGRITSSASLGFAYQEYEFNGDKFLQVLYIKSSNASSAGLRRGDFVKILKRDINLVKLEKISFENNNILYTQELSYSLDSRAKVNDTVQIDTIYNINGKKIGYLCYLEFDSPADFAEAFSKFKASNIEELILDLRYNPGGLVKTCQRLCNMIVPESAYGNLFQQSSYNDIISQENLKLYGNERTFEYFDVPNTQGPTFGLKFHYLNLSKLYVITSKNTASASESTINSLRPYMDVVVIGENTVGKGVGMYTLSSSKYKYSLVPITFRFYNANGETIPDSGIVPDYFIRDGNLTHKKDLGDLTEPLLAKAIELISSIPNKPIFQNCYCQFNENSLTPIGEPSYVIEFNNKHYNESN